MEDTKAEDFTIVVSPILSDDGTEWTGGLYTSILFNKQSTLRLEDQKTLYNICKLMCNAVLLSNIDDSFKDHLEEFTIANDSVYDLEEKFIDNKGEIPPNKKYLHNNEDNVIRIDFKTKTKGNA